MGLHVPFALTLLAYVYPFFCLFPRICIHFELLDVPNKAKKKKKKKEALYVLEWPQQKVKKQQYIIV